MTTLSELFTTPPSWKIKNFNSAYFLSGVGFSATGGQAIITGTAGGYSGGLHPTQAATDSYRVWIKLGTPLSTTTYTAAVMAANTAWTNYIGLFIKSGSAQIRIGRKVNKTVVKATASVTTVVGDWFVIAYNATTKVYSAYRNPNFAGSPTAFLTWTDSTSEVEHGAGYRYGGIRMERVSGVESAPVDEWKLEDFTPTGSAPAPNAARRELDFTNKPDTPSGKLPNWDLPTGVAVEQQVGHQAAGDMLRVANHAMTFAPTASGRGAAAYMLTGDVGGTHISKMKMQFKFQTGGRTTNGHSVILAICDQSPKVSMHMGIHLGCSMGRWALDLYDNQNFIRVGDGTFSPQLVNDGPTYTLQAVVSGNTATLLLPDGSTPAFTDARIGTWSGRFGFFECFMTKANTDKYARITHVWAEGS
jgi:hypothetical protein